MVVSFIREEARNKILGTRLPLKKLEQDEKI
jgi:hypothetical protein